MMKNRLFIITLVVNLFFVSSDSLFAINETVYSVNKNALSSSNFCDLVQDSYGFMWIATEFGLNRYDGYNFKKYYQIDGDSTSLSGNFIMSLYEDSSGRLWVGTTVGLHIYNRASDNFTSVRLRKEGRNMRDAILTIQERKCGEIWFGTGSSGIYSVDMADNVDVCLANHIKFNSQLARISSLFEDSNGEMLIGATSDGLYKTQVDSIVPILFQGVPLAGVNAIVESPNGDFYIGTATKGLHILGSNNLVTQQISSVMNIRDIHLQVEKNDLLIATDGNGIYCYDIDEQMMGPGLAGYDLSADITNVKLHEIEEDNDGNLWFGIYHIGVMAIKRESNQFEYIGHKSLENNFIARSAVSSILKSRNGKLYIGSDGSGFYELDVANKTSRLISVTGDSKMDQAVAIMSIFEDSRGGMWLSTFSNGLYYVNHKRTECKSVPLEGSFTRKISNVIEDDFGNIIVATYDSGLYILDPKSRDSKKIDKFAPTWVNSMVKNSLGDIIVGTSSGIYTICNRNGRVQIESFEFLKKSTIVSLSYDINNVLWINTRDRLYTYNPTDSESLVDITKRHPELKCKIQNVISDKAGGIWLSTNQGLFMLDVFENKVYAYYEVDGIQSNEFCTAAELDNEGRLYFGGIGGVTHFLPNAINKVVDTLSVSISELVTQNRSLTSVGENTSFVLSSNERTFSIRFSTFKLLDSDQISYYYRINDVHSEWQKLSSGNNEVKFVNLDYGNYTLDIYAVRGGESSPIKRFEIKITHPWYLTIFAKLFFGAILLIIIVLIVRHYLKHQRREKQLFLLQNKEYVNDEKLKFFINVSHEIKTPLSMIVAPLEQLLKTKKENKDVYEMMYRNATKIYSLIDEVADIQRIDKGMVKLNYSKENLVVVIQQLIEDVIYSANMKGQTIIFQHLPDVISAVVDRLYFEKIIINLLSNAIKYTQKGGNILINLEELSEDKIKIIVQDDGPGIEPELLPNIFKCFYKGTIGNVRGSTGIGLYLTQSLVELHKGEIRAENRHEIRGSRFIVTLPNCNENYIESDDSCHQPDNAIELEDKDVEKPLKPLILIVDDEIEIRKYVSSLLTKRYEIIEAENGTEAFTLAIQHQPDVIISDIMMPQMNGIMLLNKIRNNITLSLTPVILLTAKNLNEDKLEALQLGADAFIAKPFNVDILRATISNLVNRKRKIDKSLSSNNAEILAINSKKADDAFIAQLNEILSKNLSNEEFNVSSLSEEMLISRMQLNRKIKMIANTTPSNYLRNMRLNEAARLLKETELNISEVAYMVGYCNLSHFSTSFKQQFGVNAKEYSNKI